MNLSSELLDEVDLKQFTFKNFPQKKCLNDYENARFMLAEHVKQHPSVNGLYEFGTVKAIGISDLDFVVTIDENPIKGIAEHLEASNLPPLVSKLMNGGTLMVMRQKDLASITIWDDITVSPLFGNAISLIESSELSHSYLEICRLIDWLPERCARLLGTFVQEDMDVTRTIGILYSLRYSLLRLSKLLGVSDIDEENFCREIIELRKQWFLRDQTDALYALLILLKKSIPLSCLALDKLNCFLLKNKVFQEVGADKGQLQLSLGGNVAFVFSQETPGIRIKNSLHHSGKEQVKLWLPYSFIQHFVSYGVFGRSIGEIILSNFSSNSSLLDIKNLCVIRPEEYGLVLKKRILWVEQVFIFLLTFEFKSGLFKFGWYY